MNKSKPTAKFSMSKGLSSNMTKSSSTFKSTQASKYTTSSRTGAMPPQKGGSNFQSKHGSLLYQSSK